MAIEARRILLVHQGKALLPELAAYRRYFTAQGYACEALTADHLDPHLTLPSTILWLFMGFYPHPYRAAWVVHDYRSLSTGHCPGIKDKLKRLLHPRPDLRVFLNAALRDTIGFRDGVPSTLLDMGVPGEIGQLRAPLPALYDFVYVGELSRERESQRMLTRFLDRYGQRRSLLLIGPCEPAIRRRFAVHPRLYFTGRLPQEQVFGLIQRSTVGVCFVPDRRPYRLQTPTKLLEYAALGKPVIANDTPGMHRTAERLGLRLRLMQGYRFPPEEELAALLDNCHLDPQALTWDRAIRAARLDCWLPRSDSRPPNPGLSRNATFESPDSQKANTRLGA
jgi:glycosyltransferase involved in cell wall biosynthesis